MLGNLFFITSHSGVLSNFLCGLCFQSLWILYFCRSIISIEVYHSLFMGWWLFSSAAWTICFGTFSFFRSAHCQMYWLLAPPFLFPSPFLSPSPPFWRCDHMSPCLWVTSLYSGWCNSSPVLTLHNTSLLSAMYWDLKLYWNPVLERASLDWLKNTCYSTAELEMVLLLTQQMQLPYWYTCPAK